MDIFFADDSARKGSRTGMGKLVAFGGLLVPEGQIRPFAEAVDEIARDHGLPAGEELKWSPDPQSWLAQNLKGDRRQRCYSDVLEKAALHKTKAIVAVVDTGRRFQTERAALRACTRFAWERLTMHLSGTGRSAILIADRPGGRARDDDDFLADFARTTANGTEFVRPDEVLSTLTAPSHLYRQLQAADLVTGITRSIVGGSPWAESLFPAVQKLFIRNAFGLVGGTGLKIHPRELVNLYHHVLGEQAYGRPSAGSGYTLPLERGWWAPEVQLPYYDSDGLQAKTAA